MHCVYVYDDRYVHHACLKIFLGRTAIILRTVCLRPLKLLYISARISVSFDLLSHDNYLIDNKNVDQP